MKNEHDANQALTARAPAPAWQAPAPARDRKPQRVALFGGIAKTVAQLFTRGQK